MMLCRTVVINFIYLEIFTQAIQQISTGRGGAPTIRRRRRGLLKLGGGGVAGAASGSSIRITPSGEDSEDKSYSP
jgi:hypothetical protein